MFWSRLAKEDMLEGSFPRVLAEKHRQEAGVGHKEPSKEAHIKVHQ